MPVPKQPAPRDNQKARTRMALVEAATNLTRGGGKPTVAEAAEAAKISRATAYRYFPTQESLLVEISRVNPATAPVEEWLSTLQGGEPDERLRSLLGRFNRIALDEEATMRTALRTYIDISLQARAAGETMKVREGRRTRWLDEVLVDVRRQLTPSQWKRLRNALSLTLGIESMVVMKDVCHCTDAEALATLKWSALALLRAALAEARARPTTSAARKGKSRP